VFWEIRLLGLPVVSIRHEEGSEPPLWGGGTGGEFERDTEPLRADKQEPYYEEDRFGFG
jgi:hypothetical protein